MDNSITAKDKKRAEFCLNKCPGCIAARRKKRGFWRKAVIFSEETRVLNKSICPWCESYEKVYNRKAHDPIPESEEGANAVTWVDKLPKFLQICLGLR